MWLLMQLLQCALHIEIVGYGFIPRYLSVVQDAFRHDRNGTFCENGVQE